MRTRAAVEVLAGLLVTLGLAAQALAADPGKDPRVARGRYLVVVSGCNDCHTPGYMENGGPKLPEKDWLTGVQVGYQGPWGTTYPSNLRLVINGMSES